MATITSVPQIAVRFATLGWEGVSTAETVEACANNSVSTAALIGYLDALIANPSGTNDQTITTCPAATATKITAYFKARGVVAV